MRVSEASQAPADLAPDSTATSSATANTPARSAVTRAKVRVSSASSDRFSAADRYSGSTPATPSNTPRTACAAASNGCSNGNCEVDMRPR